MLRIALFEMLFEEEIPVGVSINEAVDLAKTYGTGDDASFINGVLGAVAGVESGDLKVLAILGEERSPVLPDVPTASEEGIEAYYSTWVGLYAPKGLPADVKDTLEAAVKEGVEGAPYVEFTESKGLTRKYRDAAEFTEFENFAMYEELIPSLELK